MLFSPILQGYYDIEMQKTRSQGLERRIRYYQGGIDRRCLGKGLVVVGSNIIQKFQNGLRGVAFLIAAVQDNCVAAIKGGGTV